MDGEARDGMDSSGANGRHCYGELLTDGEAAVQVTDGVAGRAGVAVVCRIGPMTSGWVSLVVSRSLANRLCPLGLLASGG